MKYYAGIGSRKTPAATLLDMTCLANNLECRGFILRSGGAAGADSAFEAGVSDPHNAKIYLPWSGFNNNPSALTHASFDAFVMAENYHPAWNRLSQAGRKFHARNCHQMLGTDLDSPVDFVICWTPGGATTGGTGQALRIAIDKDIPIFNMAIADWELRLVQELAA